MFQIVLNVIDHGLNVQQAVDSPRFHHQWFPDVLRYEEHGLVRDVEEALRAKGHKLAPGTSIGDAHSIYVNPKTENRLGAADPRMDGKAVGY